MRLDPQHETSAVLLVGGMGTRLRSVLPSAPKPLAPIGDISFLELLVLQLRSQGVRRLVMCTGYRADQIEAEFGDGGKWDVAIQYSHESQPMGTAGALKLAERYLAEDFLVLNGDSFLEIDFAQFIRFHREHQGLGTMAVRKVPDAARYGTVDVDQRGRVTGFREKTGSQAPGMINGGIYMFAPKILQRIPEGVVSLEKEIFPCVLESGVYANEQHGLFIDIGTPEDYSNAKLIHHRLLKSAAPELAPGLPSSPTRS